MMFQTEGDPREKACLQQQPDCILGVEKQAFKSLIPYVTEQQKVCQEKNPYHFDCVICNIII